MARTPMGLNYFTAREILGLREGGGLGAVLTIGHLQQFLLPGQISRLRDAHGAPAGRWEGRGFGEFADDFFAAAGARSLHALDASAYEGADIIHDMNHPVDPGLHGRFDLCVDGGSMEHIFAPGQALANTMRMVRVGGHLVLWAPANNQCGHGFFQFSPEFFFSALTAASGFAVRRIALVECVYPSVSLVAPRRVYTVRSPAELHTRVGVLSRRPLMLLISATKLTHLDEPFVQIPQQSDYLDEWDRAAGTRPPAAGLAHFLADELAGLARRSETGRLALHHLLGMAERRRFTLHNRRFFAPDAER